MTSGYTPTDPVTGLPILNVPDVVDQIPLSKQVVPWDDLAATSRPPQGPAYPNDMLNTLSYVTGESVTSPGSMHAATMTDDRRLRVDTGSSGGGATALDYQISLDANVSSVNYTRSNFQVERYIYGWQIGATLVAALPNTPQTSPLRVKIEDPSTLTDYQLAAFFLGGWGETSPTGAIYYAETWLPAPIDITIQGVAPSTGFDLILTGFFADTSFTVVMFSSPTLA